MSIITESEFLLNDLVDCKTVWMDYYMPVFKSGQMLYCKAWGKYDTSGYSHLYYFPQKNYYVVFDQYTGSCDGCLGKYGFHDEEDEELYVHILRHNAAKSYVTSDKDEAQRYYDSLNEQGITSSLLRSLQPRVP